MAGSAAARLVDADPCRFAFALASREDDEAVRRLLRGSALGDAVRVSLEREPNAQLAAAVGGDVHQTLVARDRITGDVVAIASRSVRDAFLNGEPARLGYLSQLRVDGRLRRIREVIAAGFVACRALHDAGDARVYLASIGQANGAARRLLLERPSAAAPVFVESERLATHAIAVRRTLRVRCPDAVRIQSASRADCGEIVECLQRNHRRFQFAPRWTTADLLSPARTRGLSIEDFLVAVRAGAIVGCVALWDQRAFKQAVVRGYAPPLARWRRLVNASAALTGAPHLPETGRALQFAYLSHAAVDEDRVDVLAALLAAACRRAAERGLDHVVTAFAERNPLRAAITRYARHRQMTSVLYVAHWPDGERAARSLDGRIAHPEVAVL